MLQSAVFLARPPSGFLDAARWPALTDMRRDQARSLSLAGVMVTVDGVIVYAMEGASPGLDEFLRLLTVSPCQAVPHEAWRETVRFRLQRVLAMSQPPLTLDETAALRRALDPGRRAYGQIAPLLGAAALRWTMRPYSERLTPTDRLIAG